MPFALLPAIDLTAGGLGRWTPEGPERLHAHGGDPIAVAEHLRAAGATWLHVADMDLAFGGEPANLDVVAAIAADPRARVQASGGIRTWGHAAAYLEAGAARVVMGSAALADEDEVRRMLERGTGRMVAGLEVEDGRLRPRGAAADLDLDPMTALGWLVGAGAEGVLVTSVGRVGSAAGPDETLIRRVARSGLPTLAAGGIAGVVDLRAVRRAGASGAVIGRAALDGTLDLGAALDWAAV
jgi:phosphoribosylformimino-5-aminoimidazole carboxamide ribotide isomerase